MWRYIDFDGKEVDPADAFGRVHEDGRKQVKALVRLWLPWIFIRRIDNELYGWGFMVQFGLKPFETGRRRWVNWGKAKRSFWAIPLPKATSNE